MAPPPSGTPPSGTCCNFFCTIENLSPQTAGSPLEFQSFSEMIFDPAESDEPIFGTLRAPLISEVLLFKLPIEILD